MSKLDQAPLPGKIDVPAAPTENVDFLNVKKEQEKEKVSLDDLHERRSVGAKAETRNEFKKLRKEAPVTVNALLKNGELKMEVINEKISTLSVDVLYRLEDKCPGSLLEIFATQTGDTFVFNFKGNMEASGTLGLNLFFKNQPEVRDLKVTASPERGNKVENGVRQGFKGNFMEGQNYVEVLDGYTVEVTKRLDKNTEEYKGLEQAHANAMGAYENRNDPQFKSFMRMVRGNHYEDIPTDHIEKGETQAEKLLYRVIEASANAGVDPHLTMSLLKAENGDNGRFFGVMKGEAEGFEAQLDWAIKLIQEYESRYVALGKQARDGNGRYTVGFLAYFSEIYSPKEGNPHHFKNLCKNYFAYRGEAMPSKTELEQAKEGYDSARSFYLPYKRETPQMNIPPKRVWEALKDNSFNNEVLQKMVPGWRGKTLKGGSRFGYRNHPVLKRWKLHTGLDVAAPRGTDCRPWKAGVVEFAGNKKNGYGNMVIINHGNGVKTYYAHFKEIPAGIVRGASVTPDTKVGIIGSTGMSTGPHLHFEIRIDGTPIDPFLTKKDLFPPTTTPSSTTESMPG